MRYIKTSVIFLLVFSLGAACLCGCSKEKPAVKKSTVPSSMDITALEVEEGTVTDKVTAMNEYYLSPDGSDLNDGTWNSPFRTLYYVKDVLGKFKDEISGDITVYFKGGYYRMFKGIEFTTGQLKKSDGGKITFRAYEKEIPIISGGLQLKNWEKTEVNGIKDIYKTKIADLPYIRQFYAGDEAQPRAEYKDPLEWAWLADKTKGIKVYDIKLDGLNDPSEVEVIFQASWKTFIMQAESVNGKEMKFKEPYWSNFTTIIDQRLDRGETEEYYPSKMYNIHMFGDKSFLTKPGQWYYTQKTGELYYYPAKDVDMENTDFFVPVVEDMIRITGEEDNKIANVSFDGITFCHTAWNEPSTDGLVINQAQNQEIIKKNSITGNVRANYAQMAASITVENATNIAFENCVFKNMGATCLSLLTGISDAVVRGCLFTQSSEGGLVLSNHDAATTTELSICTNNTIANNLFHKVGLDYWSAPAVSVFYAEKTTIIHNEIYDVPYSGISLGWGWYWTPNSTTSRENVVSFNKIGNFMYKTRDGGGIYTLGQQPDSALLNNYIYDQGGAFGGLYHDEGSAHFTTENNVIDNINLTDFNVNWIHLNGNEGGPNGGNTTYNLEVHNNYYSNKNTSLHADPITCVVTDNHFVEDTKKWPEEAKKIMAESGLEKEYQYLLKLVKK